MASTNLMAQWGPDHNEPPGSNFPERSIANNRPVLLYDASTVEATYFHAVLPKSYAGGGLTMRLVWRSATATTGNVVWRASFERIIDGTTSLSADDFAATQSVTSAAPGTTNLAKYAAITFTNGAQIDSLVAGEMFRVKVERDASNGSDTMTGDAALHFVWLEET